MRTVELRRHSTKAGYGNASLSLEGVERAERIGLEEMRGKGYTHFFISTLPRTGETLDALRRGAGDFADTSPEIFPVGLEVSTGRDGMRLWDGVCAKAEIEGRDKMVAAMTEDTEVAEKVAKAAAASFTAWIATLPEGAHVLVIHHSPFLEMIAYGLFGTTMPELEPCDGFFIIAENGELRLGSL